MLLYNKYKCSNINIEPTYLVDFFFLLWLLLLLLGFPGGSLVKNLPAMQDTQVWYLGQEDTLEKEMATHFSFLAWKSPGQRSLAACSPWGHKELDTTERQHARCFYYFLYLQHDSYNLKIKFKLHKQCINPVHT